MIGQIVFQVKQHPQQKGFLKIIKVTFISKKFFEALTLIQTHKIDKFPIILVGTDFWKGLVDWIKNTLLDTYENISPEDLDLVHLVDNEEEVIDILNTFYKKYNLSPNF